MFQDPPAMEDFEAQLAWSLSILQQAGEDVIFERAPADFLAYLASLHERDAADVMTEYWGDVAAAMNEFDLVVYVPVERRDRIALSDSEYPRLRKRADRMLRHLLIDDELGVADRVIEVHGPIEQRTSQILGRLK
jgi:hypothetical protein